ncbi:helix-turn-helix domain-containing protein [Kitasatospora aureofaciens]|uniref:helix-turn-helix domain-containing protein n=1 Tax=Kitasatospora aureofaciens TaxID=1894 RepID=UPI0037C917C3
MTTPPPPAAKPATERNQSSSLRRALAVLGHVREHSDGRGVPLAQLADGLGLNKSTVLRLAGPLLDEHLLDRDRETGWFRLGHGALRLGQAYLTTLDLRSVAAEHLRRLQREAGETVHLTVWRAPGSAPSARSSPRPACGSPENWAPTASPPEVVFRRSGNADGARHPSRHRTPSDHGAPGPGRTDSSY